ncbi:hypothetical protein CROQUDRAFT_672318 [Cronartium quercuum f. sp. fusiforme G11]|uniref:Cutinase n=1 Tax=Cronartium quercuum f. sp. fusiforme G11 TaxID=708437 RepID=A0A9P6TBE8_9BASI|nr:hypothetical protein CROQUDRAFT_672318 [Cronartium quercuum f. sp. fusiforme G11]
MAFISSAYSMVLPRQAQSNAKGAQGPKGCGAYTIISARGTGEPQNNPRGNSGFIRGVESAVPGGNNYEVVYPAAPDFARGPVQAVNDMVKYVESVKEKCPNQPYVLMGYSQGAMAVVRSLMRPEIQNKNVVAVVMYGDPYWTSGQPQNGGTATSGSGVASMTGIRLPNNYVSRTRDICLEGDNVCTGRGGLQAHLRYPGSPQEAEAVQFAVRKLQTQSRK